MNRRIPRHFLVLALLFSLGGCGRSGLFNATGRLTYKGQPVPSTYVTFQPEEPGKRASHGLTDDNGNFKLSFSRTETGVLSGRHAVVLKYYVSADEELHKTPSKASKEMKEGIAKYGDAKTSPLHYEVTTNGQFFDIKLP